MMEDKCQICKRKTDKIVIWINGLVGVHDLKLCKECDLSFEEQWPMIYFEMEKNGRL